MAPVTITANEAINRGEYTNGNDGKGLCPMLNGNLIYPPVAPIPAIRRARGKSPASTLKRSNSMHSLERPEDFIGLTFQVDAPGQEMATKLNLLIRKIQ